MKNMIILCVFKWPILLYIIFFYHIFHLYKSLEKFLVHCASPSSNIPEQIPHSLRNIDDDVYGAK